MKPISFINTDLQSGAYRVTDTGNLLDSPTRTIISQELARSDNAVAVFRRYGSRSYVLQGTITNDTSAELEASIDALKLALLDQIGDLSVGWGSGYRYFNSECKNVNIARKATDVTNCVWSAEFFMPKPFSTDGTTADLITAISGQTAGSSQTSTNNTGTYLADPLLTVTLTACEPNISDATITIGNPASNEYLEITDTFADGDIISINCATKQVFNGSTLLNPSGDFPAWAPGGGLLEYSDTFSSRTISITATYEPRYL